MVFTFFMFRYSVYYFLIALFDYNNNNNNKYKNKHYDVTKSVDLEFITFLIA